MTLFQSCGLMSSAVWGPGLRLWGLPIRSSVKTDPAAAAPPPNQPSHNAHTGEFLVLRAENTRSQVVRVFKKGGPCLTHPTCAPVITNPGPELRASARHPLPGRCPCCGPAKTQREPCPEKRRLTLAKELSGKFYYFMWGGGSQHRRKRKSHF